jgi:hypothetical protein
MQKLPNEELNAFLRDLMVLVHNGLRRCSMLIADTDSTCSMIVVVVVGVGGRDAFCC